MFCYSIVVDDFDSKLQKEHVEKEKPCDDHLETSNKPKAEESKGRAGTPDKSIQKILVSNKFSLSYAVLNKSILIYLKKMFVYN